MHQVGFIYKIIQGCRVNKTKKIINPRLPSQQYIRHVAKTHTNINTCLNLNHVVAIVVEES